MRRKTVVHWWHFYLRENWQLSNWMQVPFSLRKYMPSTVNIMKSSWLKESQMPEENLLLPLLERNTISKCTINHYLYIIPAYKCYFGINEASFWSRQIPLQIFTINQNTENKWLTMSFLIPTGTSTIIKYKQTHSTKSRFQRLAPPTRPPPPKTYTNKWIALPCFRIWVSLPLSNTF